jgi:putative ABC transport system permease protein
MVTHDPKAAEYATHTVHLDKGELVDARWPTDGGHGDEIFLVHLGAAVPQPHPHVADPAVVVAVPAVRHARFGARGIHLRRQRGRRQPPGGGSRLSITQSLPIRLGAGAAGGRRARRGLACGSAASTRTRRTSSRTLGVPNYFDVYRELQIDRHSWKTGSRPTGAIVGETLAKQFGWKIGDTIPLQAIFPRGGSKTGRWCSRHPVQRTVAGQRRTPVDDELEVLRRIQRLHQEPGELVHGNAGQPDHSSRVAQAIDAISANSDHETKTQTESAFQQAFVKQFADIGMIVTSIMGAVFFTLLLLTGNTMAQAVRERVPELATLKTLGFKDAPC